MALARDIRPGGGGAHRLMRQPGHSAHGHSPPLKPLRFQPLRYATDDALHAAITRFAAFLEQESARLNPSRKRRTSDGREKFRHAVEAVLCNLLRPEMALPGVALSIPLGDDVHRRGCQRYRPPAYGQHFLDLVGGVRGWTKAAGLLINLGFVTVVTKGHNVERFGRSQPTTIRPTSKLFDHLPTSGSLDQHAFSFIAPPELVVLKNRKGKPIDYSDTPDTGRWRREMQTINAMLCAAPVEKTDEANEDENGFLITPEDRALQRVFNNSDWRQGGRLAGGFWMNMKREDRYRVIHIDGGPVANVDYTAFNLRTCYSLAGAPWPFDRDVADPYVAGPGEREGWKRITNALLNVTQPLKSWPGTTHNERAQLRGWFPPDSKFADVVQAIKRKHVSISHLFENGYGLHLMRCESDLIVAVLLKLIKWGIPALPLHDSVIIAARYAATAKTIMEAEAKCQIGAAIPAKIETAGKPV